MPDQKVLVTPAWGAKDRSGNLLPFAEAKEQSWSGEQVFVVQAPGMSADEVAQALSKRALRKRRAVCVYTYAFEGHVSGTAYYKRGCDGGTRPRPSDPLCPSCGRTVRLTCASSA